MANVRAGALIEIPLRGHGTLYLAPLTLLDVERIKDLLSLEPVEFSIAVLMHQKRDLSESGLILDQLPRPTLLRACRVWASNTRTLSTNPSDIGRFSDFQNVTRNRIEEWEQSIRHIGQQFERSLPSVSIDPGVMVNLKEQFARLQDTARQISRIALETGKLANDVLSSLRASLPDPQVIAVAFEEAERGKTHLDRLGYGFVTAEWGIPELREIARTSPRSQQVHRAFLDATRDPDFGHELASRVRGSATLSRRAPIIEAAYKAHVARNYALSVPALYAQVEGVLTDLLIVEGLARRRGNRVVSSASNSELHGLRPKARQYALRQSMIRRFLTESILEQLAPDRNAVLHGSKTGYLQASRSTTLLLILNVLTEAVGSAEDAGSEV